MSKSFDRFISLVGEDAFIKVRRAKVAVVGLGGVGGAATEALARYGVGELVLVDGDVFEETNLNRQILCTRDTIGKNKARVAKDRVESINSDVSATAIERYVTAENAAETVAGASFVIDAIDDIDGKLALIRACKAQDIPIISAMGAGNRTSCNFGVCDIFGTAYDPFARKFRRVLRDAGIDSLEVVCALTPPDVTTQSAPASAAAPPFVMGAMLAARAVERLIGA